MVTTNRGRSGRRVDKIASPDTKLDHVEVLRQHLADQYKGIFDERMIDSHIAEYVDGQSADEFSRFLAEEGHVGEHMLDIGSGYGSNVLAARKHGICAIGIELASFEVEFARDRLRAYWHDEQPEKIYWQGDAMALPFESASMDLVTIMNVLEHVPDYRRVLDEAYRVLKPSGRLYLVCPNYAAFRKEAHYHVPWVPLFPRSLAKRYLQALGRNSGFFEECIHYCTNWGILGKLSGLGFRMASMDLIKVARPDLIRSPRTRQILDLLRRTRLLWLLKLWLAVGFYNPMKQSVSLVATRGEGGLAR